MTAPKSSSTPSPSYYTNGVLAAQAITEMWEDGRHQRSRWTSIDEWTGGDSRR
jgi:hypothetical protein